MTNLTMEILVSLIKHVSDEAHRILEAARSARGALPSVELELGRRLFTRWHCGHRMVQVKVFINGSRGFDEVVCSQCLYHYTLISTSYEASDS